MADSVYEGLFIFDANKFARDQSAASTSVEQAISELGGEVLVSRLWEERRLAYPINGHRKGAYWLMYFKLPGAEVTALNRRCDLNDLVLRQLVLKIHPRLVEPILAHATASPEEEDAPAEEAAGEPAGTGA
ncbi:30S ribosomal protein S6 [Posidoniimonas corsicana]|uniref:Small ribosomal subunit protein bS6 n=1 Tax=Posidoniimonas corsicana TaxID=1938618 RepID=A0A5C5VJT7_9BACT|nr:30S ribosomal protein S6 [Posidoniimonas corsicana]TWT38075.1 30S ribosomal protein S6 [Posidoniimonas corsicana]